MAAMLISVRTCTPVHVELQTILCRGVAEIAQLSGAPAVRNAFKDPTLGLRLGSRGGPGGGGRFIMSEVTPTLALLLLFIAPS